MFHWRNLPSNRKATKNFKPFSLVLRPSTSPTTTSKSHAIFPPADNDHLCLLVYAAKFLSHSILLPIPGSRHHKNLSQRYVWLGMNTDVRLWSRSCPSCQRTKIGRYTNAPLERFLLPDSKFQHVHIDLAGPLPPSKVYRYLLTIIDHFTRWPEATQFLQLLSQPGWRNTEFLKRLSPTADGNLSPLFFVI